jgi:serine/threonine protein kinase
MVDTSYGINQDGFIAIGTESIVYKGLKTRHDGGLQFSCVLKFKPKALTVDGELIDRLEIFKNEEWKIFEDLRECRSIVKIDDVVEDLGDFSLSCNKVPGGVINSSSYFCVVEEFIDGWNLDEFCREEYWKLRRIEPVGNGISKIVNFSDYGPSEKKAVLDSYNYDNMLKYQSQILLFMVNLCEILEFVTEQKNILHLDIKPENIMVTRYGKELVLIDFGKSRKVTKANRFVQSVLSDVDYSKRERLDKLFEHGTLGYAAPECYCKPVSGSKFPFSVSFEQKRMSLESDIFSFGATFWECLNMFELVTKNKQFSEDAHDFYQDNFLREETYLKRDLSCTSTHYHKKLESIIKKCTRNRVLAFADIENKDYYHSYGELKKDVENTKDSVPTILKEENVNVRKAFSVCGVMISLLLVFLIIGAVYHIAAFNIASGKWDDLAATYNDTQFYRMEEIAHDLIDTAAGNQIESTYEKIAAFTYEGNDISEYEGAMLVELLQKVNNGNLLPQRVDEIMKNANTRRFKEISTSIVKLGTVDGSVGYELAQAIFNVEVGKTGIIEAYDTLQTHQDTTEFRNAVIKLKNVLDNDANINTIADNKGLTRQDIQSFLKTITEQEEVS